MSLTQVEIDHALERLLAATCLRPALRAEFESSRREFFTRGISARTDDEAGLAARRHAEWFLLERPSEALGAVPIEDALHQLDREREEGMAPEGLRALVGSHCGAYEVTGVRAGEGVWIRDLAGFGEYPLEEREGSLALEAGDVLVGRIFPVGDSVYRISHAAGFFRNPELNRALVQDLARARAGHRGVLRLSQAELEGMFWANAAEPQPEATDAVEAARAVLRSGGMDDAEIASVIEGLSHAHFDASRLVHGVGDPLAAILERLAFDSAVDLESARRTLLVAWPSLAQGDAQQLEARRVDPPRAPSNGRAIDVRAAIEAFDRGRRGGCDLRQLFRDLERDLGLESEHGEEESALDEDAAASAVDAGSSDESAADLAPDFPGVVGAMVEEYLWDREREHGAERAAEHASLRKFATFGEGIGVFENIGARELLLFAAVWLPERGDLRGAADARGVLEALRAFCTWAEELHEVPLLAAYRASAGLLEESLPRITEANLHVVRGDDFAAGRVVEFLGGSTIADRHGHRHDVRLDPALQPLLEPGDRLRAETRERGEVRVFCCYPPESAAVDLGR